MAHMTRGEEFYTHEASTSLKISLSEVMNCKLPQLRRTAVGAYLLGTCNFQVILHFCRVHPSDPAISI